MQNTLQIPNVRTLAVFTLLSVIVYVTGTFTGIDWAVFFHDFKSSYSPPARYLRTLLCAFLAFLAWGYGLTRRDQQLLWTAFVAICIADFLLILAEKFIAGVAVFLVVHLILTVRHAQGFKESLAPEYRYHTIRYLILSALLIFIPGTLMIIVAGPALEKSHMEGLDIVYMVVLMTSAWMA